MRKTLLFGNGLGMCIDANAFALSLALGRAWNSQFIHDDARELILACLPEDRTVPEAETDLGDLQGIVAACERIMSVKRNKEGVSWLTEAGRKFPEAVYRFVFETATEMFLAQHTSGDTEGKPCALPNAFVDALCSFTESTNSHVATLNYDGLLSRALEQRGLLGSDHAPLLDGFKDGNFKRNNLFRTTQDKSWYMHLHGCPLFSDDLLSAEIKKLSPSSLTGKRRLNLRRVGRHIVLTHAKNKRAIIDASPILTTYWEFLSRAFEESVEFVLFGYSGNDPHLNRLISQARGSKPVRVIEWLGSGPNDERKAFWSSQLGGEVLVLGMESPLAFTDW